MDWNKISQIICTMGQDRGDIILIIAVEMGMKLRGIFWGKKNNQLDNWTWAKAGEEVHDCPKKTQEIIVNMRSMNTDHSAETKANITVSPKYWEEYVF